MFLFCSFIVLLISSFNIIDYKCNYPNLFLHKNLRYINNYKYEDIYKLRPSVNKLYIHKKNKFVLFELHNKTICYYKNKNYDDILGILPIISLFTISK